MKNLSASGDESRGEINTGSPGRVLPPSGGGPAGGIRKDPLPCLKCPNSDKPSTLAESISTIEGLKVLPFVKDSYGRQWSEEHGWTPSPEQCSRAFNQLEDKGEFDINRVSTSTPSEKRQAFMLFENTTHLLKKHGIEKVGFLTLTFPESLDSKECNRRFNNLNRRFLKDKFSEFITVMEPSEKGRLHYHLLVALPYDIRSGFNFDAVKRRDYRSANANLRQIWSDLRETLPRYGFGRSELMPIRTNLEAAAKYVGKYISKGSRFRSPELKRARLVRYSQGWRVANGGFSWSVGAPWRAYLGEVAQCLGITSYDQFSTKYGRYWGYVLKQWYDKLPTHPEMAAYYLKSQNTR